MPLSLVAVKMSPGYLIDIDTLYSMVEVGRGGGLSTLPRVINGKAYISCTLTAENAQQGCPFCILPTICPS